MKIVYDKKFQKQLVSIWNYIAQDSESRANGFKIELKLSLENLIFFPYKYRKSIYFDNNSIRDFIFKGYVVPYKIEQEQIVILGIKKYTKGF